MRKLFTLVGMTTLIFVNGCGIDSQQMSGLHESSIAKDSKRAKSSHETTIRDVAVRPTNGGINPQYRAIEIGGIVQLGGNRCSAAGKSAELVEEVVDDTVYVKPMLNIPSDSGRRICTLEYMPVFTNVTHVVRVDSEKIKKIIIKNVDEMGNNVDANDFLGSSKE